MSETAIPEATKNKIFAFLDILDAKGQPIPSIRVIAAEVTRMDGSCGVSSRRNRRPAKSILSRLEFLMKAFPRRLTTPWPLSAQPLRKH